MTFRDKQKPFWEDGCAYFDADDLHVSFIEKTGYLVSGWQTANALTRLGVRSVQRRLGGGSRRRIRVLPIPPDAICEDRLPTDAEMAGYWAERGENWVGPFVGEEFANHKREYETARTVSSFHAILPAGD